jgi:hypothetical protein
MKKLLLYFCFLCLQSIFSQEYHFDRLIQYKETNGENDGSNLITVMFNSKNTSYYFVNKSWNKEISAYLVDTNLNLTHNYTISDFNKSKDYKYLYSKRFNPEDCSIDCSKINIEESKNTGQFSKTVMKKYTNEKKKKVFYEIEVISKPYDFGVLNILIKILQHHFLFCDEIKVAANSIPTSLKLRMGTKVKLDQSLALENNIDINFEVKEENLIFREASY